LVLKLLITFYYRHLDDKLPALARDSRWEHFNPSQYAYRSRTSDAYPSELKSWSFSSGTIDGTSFFKQNQMDNRVREDPKIRVTLNFGTPPVSNINLRPPKVSHQKNKVLTGSKTLLKPIKQITHNLSAINLRNPEMSPPYPRRKTAQ
jgi:hypothetical protein